MKVYLDSSVVLRWLLGQPDSVHDWARREAGVVSELMEVEVRRCLDRLRLLGTLSPQEIPERLELLRRLLRDCSVCPIQREVLDRASAPFPAVVGTLDAIHLATALLWMEDNDERLVFLTHDRQMALAAQSCGMAVEP